MKTERIDWDRLVPAGMDARWETRRLLWGLVAATVWSVLLFLANYVPRLREVLYYLRWSGPKDIQMHHFARVLGGTMLGFGIAAAAMFVLAVNYYLYHYQGSRSINLMRRLPDKWDLWRRCLTVPALGLAVCALLPALLTLIYFFVYRLFTPAEACAPPEAQEGLYLLLCRVFS